jgi:VanZ family protein
LFPGSLLGCYIYNDCKIQPQITVNYIVSTNHLYAYIALSFIGFLTYRKNNQFNILSIYLIFLSILLEVLQYFVPYRSFEFSDLFGNLAGVIIAIIIFYFFKKNENFKN